MIKWIYLARRGEGIAREEFPRIWRGHSRLASRFPDLAAYFQATIYCHLTDREDGPLDAAGILTLDGATAISAVLSHPDAVATMHPDERRVFGEEIATCSLAAEEDLLLGGPVGSHAALLLLRERRGDLSGCVAAWLSQTVKPPSRCVVDHFIPGIFPSRLPWAAAVELYADDGDQCRALAASLASTLNPASVEIVDGPVVLAWHAERAGE